MSIAQKYYDLKTIQKIALLIGFMSIAILIVGGVGFIFNKKSNDALESMFVDRLEPVYQLTASRAQLWKIKCNIFDAYLDEEEREQRVKEINKSIDLIDSYIETYSKTKMDETESNMFKEYLETKKIFDKQLNEIIKAYKAENKELALKITLENEENIDDLSKKLKALGDYNVKVAKDIDIQNDKDSVIAQTIIVTAIILAIVLSILFGAYISLNIQRILEKLVNKMNDVANGNLNIEKFGLVSKSDTGQLCSAFDTMLTNLRALVSEVSKSVEEISAASEEMSASADQTAQGSQQTANSTAQLAQGTQEISHNVEQGANTIGNMNKVIQEISKEAVDIAQLGNNTETNANEGSSHIQKAVYKIDSIKTVAGDISVTVSKLGTLSSEIETIVDLIKSIAGQTNLLALNAAIEAARAGEHGKGFAVVAEEVKKLATQSAEATDKITAMIKEIQSETGLAVNKMDKATNEVEEGVNVVNNAGKALESIIEQVKAANGKIQGITKEIEGVANSSDDVVKMIENISAVTEQTAASAEEISSITQEQTASMEEISANSQSLAKVAESLTKQVSAFKL